MEKVTSFVKVNPITSENSLQLPHDEERCVSSENCFLLCVMDFCKKKFALSAIFAWEKKFSSEDVKFSMQKYTF